MKTNLLLATIAFGSGVSFAQSSPDWGGVPVIMDSYGHKISRDGVLSTGEAVTIESGWCRNNLTGEEGLYEACTIGYGNPVSKDYRVVGTDKIFMKGAFLIPNAEPILVPSLEKYSESYLHGINWDGTRICGFVSNPKGNGLDEFDPDKMSMMYLPVYCDVDPATGNVGNPVFLPTPPRDFFGLPPQYCTAFWISDDGRTILGQVIDNSGFYIYPILYIQGSDGNWSYSLPSEELFNPDNLTIPVWPKPEMDAPQAEDYIGNPEMKALFQQLLDEWDGDELTSPYNLLNPATAGNRAIMTQTEWNAFQQALKEYAEYSDKYEIELNRYYEEYSFFIAHSTNFLQSSMAMNPQGTLISQTKIVQRIYGATEIVSYHIPVLFNLENGTYQILGEDNSEMEIQQIMSDGTLIAATPKPGSTSPDLTPQHSYVYPVGGKDFIPIEDFIKDSNPVAYDWMQRYLFHDVPVGYDEISDMVYKPMTVTGLVAVSDDWSTMSGGVDTWSWDLEDGEYITYFLTDLNNPNAGIEGVPVDSNQSEIKIYNLQGVKIDSSLESLPHGVYIINGKKIAK